LELRLDRVSKRHGAGPDAGFDTYLGVGGVDLTFPSGKTTALLGPSGCGKSTVLRLLVGLTAPDAGAVLVDGKPLAAHDLGTLRRRMGYVIQDGGLFPHLSARDNVTLMARHLGWDRARIEARLAELVALTRFPAGGLGRHATELSGGQQQRVAEVLLLDEPLGALDSLVRAELRDDLRGIFRSFGKTVVIVTHDVGEATFLADFIVLMRAGRVVQQGPFATLSATPADPFVAAFLKSGDLKTGEQADDSRR
jgi:osmoprotectant transport system ATP-binding protein